MIDKFAVFILTHGRPDKVITYHTLRRCGYTGDIYIIVDNEDKTIDQYRANFGDKVIVFDKAAVAQTFDEAGIFEDRRAVVYARNASFQIAKDLGLDYFLQLDDDYYEWRYRFTSNLVYTPHLKLIHCLDKVFNALLEYFKGIPALTLAMAQTGDFIGGGDGANGSVVGVKRKTMNTFFCSTARPFQFLGRINEDVNTYVTLGNRGELFLSIMQVCINQTDTQQNSGGMTELYLDSGTYIKSFYTVMFSPSAVTVQDLGVTHKRLHTRVSWNNAVPCILSETYRNQTP